MKKYIIISILTLILVNLFAFEAINPASEMSGKYLRLTSLNQKSFIDFDDGFNRIALSIAKPALYKNWSIASDAKLFGDDVFKEILLNISPAYTFQKKYTFALSLGLINRSLQSDKLIFGEAENIDTESVTQPNIGASFLGNFFQNKLEFKILSTYLNQPEVNFLNDSESKNMFVQADLNWKINRSYQIGLSYKNDENISYFGLNFDYKFPYPNLKHSIYLSQEKISYKPTFSLINYWDVAVGYDLFWDNDLGYKNLEIDLTYQYTGKEAPEITILPFNEISEKMDLEFSVLGADRFYKISVTINDDKLLELENIWDENQKSFIIPIELIDGDNSIMITATSSSNITTTLTENIFKEKEEIVPEVVEEKIIDEKQDESLLQKEESTLETSLQETNEEIIEEKIDEPAITPQPEVNADLVIIDMPIGYHPPQGHPFLYEVLKGDNLWNIAKRSITYGNAFKWTRIHIQNGLIINDPNLIFPGQLLYIEHASKHNKLIDYTIKENDNLWDISYNLQKLKPVRRILIMSNKETILDPSLIHPNDNIIIKIFIIE